MAARSEFVPTLESGDAPVKELVTFETISSTPEQPPAHELSQKAWENLHFTFEHHIQSESELFKEAKYQQRLLRKRVGELSGLAEIPHLDQSQRAARMDNYIRELGTLLADFRYALSAESYQTLTQLILEIRQTGRQYNVRPRPLLLLQLEELVENKRWLVFPHLDLEPQDVRSNIFDEYQKLLLSNPLEAKNWLRGALALLSEFTKQQVQAFITGYRNTWRNVGLTEDSDGQFDEQAIYEGFERSGFHFKILGYEMVDVVKKIWDEKQQVQKVIQTFGINKETLLRAAGYTGNPDLVEYTTPPEPGNVIILRFYNSADYYRFREKITGEKNDLLSVEFGASFSTPLPFQIDDKKLYAPILIINDVPNAAVELQTYHHEFSHRMFESERRRPDPLNPPPTFNRTIELSHKKVPEVLPSAQIDQETLRLVVHTWDQVVTSWLKTTETQVQNEIQARIVHGAGQNEIVEALRISPFWFCHYDYCQFGKSRNDLYYELVNLGIHQPALDKLIHRFEHNFEAFRKTYNARIVQAAHAGLTFYEAIKPYALNEQEAGTLLRITFMPEWQHLSHLLQPFPHKFVRPTLKLEETQR